MYFVCIFSFFALNQCKMLVADRGRRGSGSLKVMVSVSYPIQPRPAGVVSGAGIKLSIKLLNYGYM